MKTPAQQITATVNLKTVLMETYSDREVESLAHEDRWAVRDEGFRRAAIAAKKVAAAQKMLEKALALAASAKRIVDAAEHEARREAATIAGE